jgi:aryl-alcohol dehydrogenase-like predicted oxidoreductase
MKYRRLGKTGPTLSLVGIGCNNFGGRADYKVAQEVVGRAIDVGITFFDTADSYGKNAASEEFLGKALGARRKDIVLATKFGNIIKGSGLTERPQATKAYVKSAAEASLKRLKTDYIDLYQMHYPDPRTPIEEALEALNALVKEGKVRHFGCSNFSVAQLAEAEKAASKAGIGGFISCQNEYSLLERDEESLKPTVEAKGMGFLPYSPLAGGVLSGKYRAGQDAPKGARFSNGGRFLTDANLKIVDALRAFAEARGQTLLNLAFGWLAAQPWVSCVMAGAMTGAQVEQNAKAVEWLPSATEMTEINRLVSTRGG